MRVLIDRDIAIEEFKSSERNLTGINGDLGGAMSGVIKVLETIPPVEELDVVHIISETLSECGVNGIDATIVLVNVLKRLGRSDLLLPCLR